MQKKIVIQSFVDEETGIHFIEDDRGNYHFIPPYNKEMKVVVENPENSSTENKRLRRVLERLRMENNWLWEVVETAIRERKRMNSNKVLDRLEKKVKEKA